MRLDEVENGTVALNAGRRNLKGTIDLIMMNYKANAGMPWGYGAGIQGMLRVGLYGSYSFLDRVRDLSPDFSSPIVG